MATDLLTAGTSSPKTPSLRQNDDGSVRLGLTLDSTLLGAGVCVQEVNPTNADAIYTVPAGKTFTGYAYIRGAAAGGTLSLSAATGGVVATVVGVGPDLVPVTIAGGGGGNAVTAVVSGGGLGSVALIGNVK